MAIFTNTANYLKCRSFFEDVLGFEVVDNSDANFSEYGFLCSMRNLRIAQNIWFLYGGALPWDTFPTETETYGEDNPPLETEDGFVIRENGFTTGSECGFILDSANGNFGNNKYFIGMKRLVPLEDETSQDHTKSLTYIRSNYKNIIKFMSDEYADIQPTNADLNAKKPNQLKITTSYDYGDFGKLNNKEYDVRQIGMLNHLCCSADKHDLIMNENTLYNKDEYDNNLASIFNISNASIILPSSLEMNDFFPNGTDVDSIKDQTKMDTTGFFGVLQFYLNSRANNRITYQTDYYSFILKFENKLKCECTCENCSCND